MVFCSAAMFVIVGECKFGAACKFSHLTPVDKERLLAAGEFKLISTKQLSELECIHERTVVVTDLPTHKHTQPQTDRTDYNTLHSSYHAV